MMSTTTESPFSYTIKVGAKGDLLTGRAENYDQMSVRISELLRLKLAIEGNTSAPAEPTAAPTQAQAVQNFADAGMVASVTQIPAAPAPGIEEIADRWGNTWVYGHPDAPALPDGRGSYARKTGTSKTGKQYTGWFDPAKGPKPFPVGAVEAEPIFPPRGQR